MTLAEQERIDAAAKAAAAEAPPFTPEQEARLRVLLAPLAKALTRGRKNTPAA